MMFIFLLILVSSMRITTSFAPSIHSPYRLSVSSRHTNPLTTSLHHPPTSLYRTQLFSTDSPSDLDLDNETSPPPSDLPKYRRFLSKINPFKKNDDAPLKEQLLKLGLAAFLAYGFVSNLTYAVMLSLGEWALVREAKRRSNS